MSDLDVFKTIQELSDGAIKEIKNMPEKQGKDFLILTLFRIEAMANTILLIEQCDPIISKEKEKD